MRFEFIAVVIGAAGEVLPPVILVVFVPITINRGKLIHDIKFGFIRVYAPLLYKSEVKINIISHDQLCRIKDAFYFCHKLMRIRRILDSLWRNPVYCLRFFPVRSPVCFTVTYFLQGLKLYWVNLSCMDGFTVTYFLQGLKLCENCGEQKYEFYSNLFFTGSQTWLSLGFAFHLVLQ